MPCSIAPVVVLPLLLFVVSFSPAESATPEECVNALYRGMVKQDVATQKLVLYFVKNNVRPRATCELLDLLVPLSTEDFNAAGCSWGYPNHILEQAVMGFAGYFVNEDCPIFHPTEHVETGEYGLQCYVDEEVETALTSLVGCAMKLEGLGLGPGDECQAMEALSPCLMHIVDDCHDDNGEASAGILMALAAQLSFLAEKIDPGSFSSEVVSRIESCPADVDVGVFRVLTSVDAGWRPDPSSGPSEEEIAAAVGDDSTELTINEEAVAELMAELQQYKGAVEALAREVDNEL